MFGLKSSTFRTGREDGTRRRCPSQCRRRCRRRDEAVGSWRGKFMDASVADVLLPEHTQEAPLAARVEYIEATAAIGEGAEPCLRVDIPLLNPN